MIFSVISAILALTFGTSLYFSVKKNLELLEKLEDLSEQVEESLDLLDVYHQKIDIISKTEVMFDDPIVKNLLDNISGCKDAVLLIANKLYGSLEINEEEK